MKRINEFLEEAVGSAEIQFQDLAGTWKSISRTINQPLYIIRGMQDAKKVYKNRRIRAIEPKSGTLLDILP